MKIIYRTLIFTFAFLLVSPLNAIAQTEGDDAPVAPSNFCVSLTRDMGYRTTDGQVGGEVSALQDYLQDKGYLNSEPTGFFGKLTVVAVKSFQTANGIRPTGYVGPVTRTKVQSLSCTGSATSVTSTNSQNNFNDRQAVSGNNNSKVGFGTPINVKAGEKILFTWSTNFPYIPNDKDWIGLVPKGHVWKAGDGAQYKWVYTYGKNNGSGEIQGPSKSGLYDLVYFENDLLKEVARSSSINVVSSAGLQVQTTSSNTNTTNTNSTGAVATIPTVNLEIVGDIKPSSGYVIKWTSTNTRACSSPNGSIIVNGSATNLPVSGSVEKIYVSGTSPQFQINCVGDGGYTSRSIVITSVNTTQTVTNNQTATSNTSTTQDNIAPSTPTNVGSSNVTSNSATITWSGSSDNIGVIGYRVYRNGVHIASSQSTSYSDSGLSGATTYIYSVLAYDAVGNQSQLSNTKSVTTLQGTLQATTTVSTPDTTKPTAPTNLASSSISPTSFTLSWSASSDNVGVTGYRVYRNGTLVASPTGTSATISGLSSGVQYSMTVNAVDAAGNASVSSSALLVTTSVAADTQAPTVPTGLSAGTVTSSSFTLSWNASTDNVGVTGYRVYQNGSLISSPTNAIVNVTGLSQATTYSYTVTAVDGAGNVSQTSSSINVTTVAIPDTQAPTIPGAPVTSNVTQNSVNLNWNPSTDNTAVTGYKIYMNGTMITTAGTQSVYINGLIAGTTYSFTIVAYDAAGNNSAQSSPTSVTTQSAPVVVADTQAPTAPQVGATNLCCSDYNPLSLNLVWQGATDNVGIAYYKIYLNGNLYTTVSGSQSSQYVSGLSRNSSYNITVTAQDAAGNVSSAGGIALATRGGSSAPIVGPIGGVVETLPAASALSPVDESTGATLTLSGSNVVQTDNPANCVSTYTTGCGRLSEIHQFANSNSSVVVNYNLTNMSLTPRSTDSIVVIQYTTSGLVVAGEQNIGTSARSGSVTIQMPNYVSGTYNSTRYGLYYLAYVQKTSTTAYRYIDPNWIGIYATGMNPY